MGATRRFRRQLERAEAKSIYRQVRDERRRLITVQRLEDEETAASLLPDTFSPEVAADVVEK